MRQGPVDLFESELTLDMPQLDRRLPSIASMERAAKRRMPKFAFDYLQGGIGAEACLAGNR